MGLINALNRIVVPVGDLNALKAGDRARHYEVYYLTFNHRASRTGFWIRYTLDRRGPGASPSEAALWFHCFRRDDASGSFGGKQRFDPGALGAVPGVDVRIDGSELGPGRASGTADIDGRRVAWEIAFVPSPTAVWLAPGPLRAIGLAKTSVVYANLDARFRGRVTVDGEAFELRDEPGCQTHLWGEKRAHGWAWGHCNAFDGDAPCAIDGVAAFLKRGARVVGPLTGVFVRYRGDDYLCNAVHTMVRARAELAFPTWSFTAGAGGTRFVGRFAATPERMLQAAYEDADGERAYCCNSEVGDLELEVWRDGARVETLRATGTAHLEFVSRERRPDVRVTVGG